MIVTSQVSPLPTFDVRPVGGPNREGYGFLLIAVPRTSDDAHAVLLNEGVRFPKRNGTAAT
jgi:hypothetical protein